MKRNVWITRMLSCDDGSQAVSSVAILAVGSLILLSVSQWGSAGVSQARNSLNGVISGQSADTLIAQNHESVKSSGTMNTGLDRSANQTKPRNSQDTLSKMLSQFSLPNDHSDAAPSYLKSDDSKAPGQPVLDKGEPIQTNPDPAIDPADPIDPAEPIDPVKPIDPAEPEPTDPEPVVSEPVGAEPGESDPEEVKPDPKQRKSKARRTRSRKGVTEDPEDAFSEEDDDMKQRSEISDMPVSAIPVLNSGFGGGFPGGGGSMQGNQMGTGSPQALGASGYGGGMPNGGYGQSFGFGPEGNSFAQQSPRSVNGSFARSRQTDEQESVRPEKHPEDNDSAGKATAGHRNADPAANSAPKNSPVSIGDPLNELDAIQPMVGLEQSTGGIEIKGLDQTDPDRPRLQIVCKKPFRQLQIHSDGQQLPFNAPLPDQLRSVPLSSRMCQPGIEIRVIGIGEASAEVAVFRIPNPPTTPGPEADSIPESGFTLAEQ